VCEINTYTDLDKALKNIYKIIKLSKYKDLGELNVFSGDLAQPLLNMGQRLKETLNQG
jgi:hypothetical protein